MRILVTGGAGFIGSYFVETLLQQNNEIIVLDNLLRGNKLPKEIIESITFVKGDVRDTNLVMECTKRCDLIYHFAAVLGVDIVCDNPKETMETEAVGIKNIVDAAVTHNVKKIIYASTSGVYGHSAIERSVSEDIQLDPRTSYAIAKRYCEIYLAAAYQEKQITSISLRLFNVYGPRQDKRMVIPIFFDQAMKSKPITVYGTGNQTRDFTSVNDVVKATIRLAENASGCKIYNIAHESEVSINKLADIITVLTNSKSDIINVESPKKRYDFEVERRVGSSEKLFKEIGYKPSTSLNDGLLAFYKSIIPK